MPFLLKKSRVNFRKIKLIFLCNTLIINANSQTAKNDFSIETDVHIGRLIKHTSKLLFNPPPLSIGSEIHLNWQLNGTKPWHEWQNFPSVGVSLLYFDFGNQAVLGSAVAAFPTIDLTLRRRERSTLTTQIGYGIAFLTEHYDFVNNPMNNAIGSFYNNLLALKFKYNYRFSNKITAHAGISFTHFSAFRVTNNNKANFKLWKLYETYFSCKSSALKIVCVLCSNKK